MAESEESGNKVEESGVVVVEQPDGRLKQYPAELDTLDLHRNRILSSEKHHKQHAMRKSSTSSKTPVPLDGRSFDPDNIDHEKKTSSEISPSPQTNLAAETKNSVAAENILPKPSEKEKLRKSSTSAKSFVPAIEELIEAQTNVDHEKKPSSEQTKSVHSATEKKLKPHSTKKSSISNKNLSSTTEALYQKTSALNPSSTPQPIPPSPSVLSKTPAPTALASQQDDIAEEDAQSRDQAAVQKIADCIPCTSSDLNTKKDISWNENYSKKVSSRRIQELATQSEGWMLDRTASVGPCYKQGESNQPSGITVYLPKKSVKSISEDIIKVSSGISISIFRRDALVKAKSNTKTSSSDKINIHIEHMTKSKVAEKETKEKKLNSNCDKCKVLECLRGKLDNIYIKIRNVII